MTFEMIKRNYDHGLWNKKMVAVAVVKGVITPEQYQEITGEDYAEPENVPKSAPQILAEHDEALNTLAGVTQ
nr:MAG TPA: hypothetical protein [Caudoviricetes sp.]